VRTHGESYLWWILLLWILEDLVINFLYLLFFPVLPLHLFYFLTSFLLHISVFAMPYLTHPPCYSVWHTRTSGLPFRVCLPSLLATEIPTAGPMCCLLAIASTDNIFTAFSIYKVRVKESCEESTGGQGEICTFPTDVNKSTDREQRSATFWPPPSCLRHTRIQLMVQGVSKRALQLWRLV
jgi:hypothetical protein